jgi:BMFP domain-containing protein YqiC
MEGQNRFFDDVARVASGAVGAITGVRDEIEARLRDQLERVLAGMDLVSREEFEAVKAMAAKARDEQEVLQRRLEALEARLAGPGASPPIGPGQVGKEEPGSSIP